MNFLVPENKIDYEIIEKKKTPGIFFIFLILLAFLFDNNLP